MITAPKINYISPEDYLLMEEKSSTKHEYINGETYDMAGASGTHVTIAGNLFVFLRNHLISCPINHL